MNRLEWFNNQTDEVKSKFEYNCVNLNDSSNFFEWWLKKNNNDFANLGDTGISGAFRWSETEEGFDYWKAIDKELTK